MKRKPATIAAGPLRSGQLRLETLEPRLMLADGPLLISELMAINDTGLTDSPGGDTPDWIEIHNPTNAAVSLEGWYLTDNDDDMTKWQFPAVSIDRNGYLVVFASGKDLTDPAQTLHTNFRLSGGGEHLALVWGDG